MSIYAISWVLRYSEAERGERLVLIALADYAQDDGRQAYPAVESIARKARLTGRSVQYALRKLEENGQIIKTGKRQSGTNVYQIVMDGGGERTSPPGGVQSTTGGGEVSDTKGVKPTSPNPSGDPSKDPSKKQQRRSRKNGDRFEADPDSEQDRVIVEIFEAWHTGAKQPASSYLTVGRASKIRARLGEAMGPEATLLDARNELLNAVKGLLTSKWHVQQGEIGFPLIFRDRERVLFCLERLAKTQQEEPDAVERFSAYDQQIQNRAGTA